MVLPLLLLLALTPPHTHAARLVVTTHENHLRPNGVASSVPVVQQRTLPDTTTTAAGKSRAAIMLMTKNEWPLVKSWVLHHSDLFGRGNVHVLDMSSDARVVSFLERARTRLGINVSFIDADLATVGRHLNAAIQAIKHDYDFVFKADTDDFYVVLDTDLRTPLVTHAAWSHYLATLPYDGRKYAILRRAEAVSTPACRPGANPATSIRTFMPFAATADLRTNRKHFYPAPRVVTVDMGTHFGNVSGPGDALPPVATRVAIVHYKHQCFDDALANDVKALVGHRYIKPGQSRRSIVAKLAALSASAPCVLSCHKVRHVLAYLRHPRATRRAYYAQFDARQAVALPALTQRLVELEVEFDKG